MDISSVFGLSGYPVREIISLSVFAADSASFFNASANPDELFLTLLREYLVLAADGAFVPEMFMIIPLFRSLKICAYILYIGISPKIFTAIRKNYTFLWFDIGMICMI